MISANVQKTICVFLDPLTEYHVKGVSFLRNCGAASVGILQDNLVLSTELTM